MKKLLITGLLIIVLMAIIAASLFSAVNKQASPNLAFSSIAPGRVSVTWIADDNQANSQNQLGDFKVRGYVTTSKSVLFLCSFKSASSLPLQIEATSRSITASGEKVVNPLAVSDFQTFDRPGDFEVGTIEVRVNNLPGQIVSLRAVFPGVPGAIWQVSPIKQNFDSNNDGSNSYYHSANALASDINVGFGGGGSTNSDTLNSFQLSLSKTPSGDTSTTYYRLGTKMDVVAITASEYRKLNLPLPVTSSSNQNQDAYWLLTPKP